MWPLIVIVMEDSNAAIVLWTVCRWLMNDSHSLCPQEEWTKCMLPSFYSVNNHTKEYDIAIVSFVGDSGVELGV